MANSDKPDLDKMQDDKKGKGIPTWVTMLTPLWMIILLALVIGIMILFDCSPDK